MVGREEKPVPFRATVIIILQKKQIDEMKDLIVRSSAHSQKIVLGRLFALGLGVGI